MGKLRRADGVVSSGVPYLQTQNTPLKLLALGGQGRIMGETMQDSSSNFITVSTEFGASAQFVALERNGRLIAASEAIWDRSGVVEQLGEVERQLIACNDKRSLAELAIWCLQRRRNFEAKLRKLATSLEAQKCRLLTKLQTIDQRLAQEHPGVELVVDLAPMTSLVPRRVRKGDEYVAERNGVIDGHLDLPSQEICKLLDMHFSRDGQCPDHLPKTWTLRYGARTFTDAYRDSKCRNLVQRLISGRRNLRGVTRRS